MDDKEKLNDIEEEGEFLADLIELTDEEGNVHTFELVDTLDHKDNTYVALIASVEGEDFLEGDGDLIIMRVMPQEGEEDFLVTIEDEDEFDEISEMFMERLADLYDFDEEDSECSCGCHHDHEHHHDDDKNDD